MTNEQIKKGNKLIAGFLGWEQHHAYEIKDAWEPHDCLGGTESNEIWVLNPTETFLQNKAYGANAQNTIGENLKLYDNWAYDLHYHKSWDLLMPAIEKIESLGYDVKIEGYRWYKDDEDKFDFSRVQQLCLITHRYNIKINSAGHCNDDRLDKLKATWASVVYFIENTHKTATR